ncbi:hypothetical protein AB6G19_24330 [Providencia manganoxydans]
MAARDSQESAPLVRGLKVSAKWQYLYGDVRPAPAGVKGELCDHYRDSAVRPA